MDSDIQIRSAIPVDALAVAGVHVRSWQVAYRDLLPSEYLDSLRPDDRAASYDFTHSDPARPHTRVAATGSTILGFATIMPSTDPAFPCHSELCALYVDPDRWGSGIGVALIADARDRMARQGFRHALLWVLKGNVRADKFYRNDGWAPDGGRKRNVMWGVEVEDLRYRGLYPNTAFPPQKQKRPSAMGEPLNFLQKL